MGQYAVSVVQFSSVICDYVITLFFGIVNRNSYGIKFKGTPTSCRINLVFSFTFSLIKLLNFLSRFMSTNGNFVRVPSPFS